MAMVNLEIIDIIREIYEELANNVLLKNIPKDCPNIDEIKANYLFYLLETYKSHKPIDGNRESVKEYIISQQKELWDDEVVYNIYRNRIEANTTYTFTMTNGESVNRYFRLLCL